MDLIPIQNDKKVNPIFGRHDFDNINLEKITRYIGLSEISSIHRAISASKGKQIYVTIKYLSCGYNKFQENDEITISANKREEPEIFTELLLLY